MTEEDKKFYNALIDVKRRSSNDQKIIINSILRLYDKIKAGED